MLLLRSGDVRSCAVRPGGRCAGSEDVCGGVLPSVLPSVLRAGVLPCAVPAAVRCPGSCSPAGAEGACHTERCSCPCRCSRTEVSGAQVNVGTGLANR